MNKARRKRIEEVSERLDELRAEVSSIAEEERESFENLPESLQEGERGQAMEQAADTLEEVEQELEDLCDRLSEAAE